MHMNSSKSLKILIADDDEDDRALAAMAFQEASLQHEVQFFKNGEELMNYLCGLCVPEQEGYFPDLILLDLNMPKKDGRIALKEIKQHEKLRDLNVIIFSTSISEIDREYTMGLGASDYITKPPGFFQLVELFKKICGSLTIV